MPKSRAVARIEPAPAAPAEKSAVDELLCRVSGCSSPGLARALMTQARSGHARASAADRSRQLGEVLAFVEGIGPTDVIESALAAQMCALHNLAMRALERASYEKDGTIAGVMTARALRLIAANHRCLEVLDRHRAQGRPQIVRVERVTVNAGGQAIVGAVEVGGG